MNTIGDFLNSLAKKCNLEQDAGLIGLLSNSTLATTPMPDALAHSFDTTLMSLEGAKNNPAVLNHFKPIVLKAVDDKFAIFAEKYGISDEVAAEKSSYKKFDILQAKLDSLETKREKTNDPTKEAQFTEQIKNLTGQLAQLTTAKETEIQSLKDEYGNKFTDMLVSQGLTSKKYANKDISSELNVTIAKTVLQKQMAAKGAILVNENGVLKLKQSANPTLDYVDSGFKAVSYSDFTDAILAENKLLEITGVQQTQQTQSVPATVQMDAKTQTNVKFDSAMNEALASIKL